MKSVRLHALRSTVDKILRSAHSEQDHVEKFLSTQKLACIGKFTGDIAHKLNNILGGILGYSQLLQEELEPTSNAFKQACEIESASKRAAKILTQLLIISDDKIVKKRAIDPEEVIQDVVTIFENSLKKKVSLSVHFNHKSRKIWANYALLSQALMNLCLNARDAIIGDGHITIETELLNDEIVFKIQDTGTGIKEELLPFIFEPFFTTKEEGIGSGLGLTVVDGIVRHHKGEIKVLSEEDKGSTFTVAMPVAQEAHSNSKKRRDSEDLLGEGELIMVVDDEKDLREIAKKIFEKKGYRVLLAEDGSSALRVFNECEEEIKLVILDLIMPGLDGAQVYNELKTKESDTKIILTSGYTKDTTVQTIIDEGTESFVAKPWEVTELLRITKEVLSHR
ncbi:MAG: response regulator [bacterium]